MLFSLMFLTDPPHPLGTLQSAPELGDLMNEIATEIPERWKEVAIGLGLVDSDIKLIKNDVPTQKAYPCYMEVFGMWKNRITKPYTWETILRTLRTKLVNAHSLAAALERRMTRKRHIEPSLPTHTVAQKRLKVD